MADIEKVIKCLELCRILTDSCEGCPYENVPPPVENCIFTMHDDAFALLKEQEAQKQSILKNIADNQLANSPDEWQSPEQRMYSKGVFDGLQMAYEMLAYGVVK